MQIPHKASPTHILPLPTVQLPRSMKTLPVKKTSMKVTQEKQVKHLIIQSMTNSLCPGKRRLAVPPSQRRETLSLALYPAQDPSP